MKKHIKMSENVFREGLGLFWSSNEVKMTKCCLVCIRAQAPLEEAWVLWWVPKWVKTTEKGLYKHVLTCFHHFWAIFCLKPTRNALFTLFLVQNGQVAVTSRRHGIRNFRIRVLLYGISVPIGYEFSAKHFQNFFFGAQWVLCSSMHYTLRRFDNLVIKREIHGAPRRSFWILLFCLVFFDNEAF